MAYYKCAEVFVTSNSDTVLYDASGSIVSFSSKLSMPLKSLKVAITAKQSGSGTPSSDNIMPITGWNGAVVNRCGINLWNEEWEVGSIDPANGTPSVANNVIRSKNFIRVKGSSTCYLTNLNIYAIFQYDENYNFLRYNQVTINTFSFDSDVKYIKFRTKAAYGTTYNNDISINYPSTDTAYHAFVGNPYTQYFEGLLNGTYGFVDLDTLTWNDSTSPNVFVSNADEIPAKTQGAGSPNVIICSKYNVSPTIVTAATLPDKNVTLNVGGNKVVIHDSSYSDAQTFKNSLSGVYLIYELATPITPTITQSQIDTLATAFGVKDKGVIVVLGDTYYGGSLDVTNGVLTVTWGNVDLGALNYQYNAGTNIFTSTNMTNFREPSTTGQRRTGFLCDIYPPSSTVAINANMDDKSMLRLSGQINIRNTSYTSEQSFKSAMSGHQIVYSLATPFTVQLTPTQIEQLLGANDVFADCGDVEELIYTDISPDLIERCVINNAELWATWSIPTNNPSQIIYRPTESTYFMLPATTPMSLLVDFAAFTGGDKYGIHMNHIRFNPYLNNSGRMATNTNYPTAQDKRLPLNQFCQTSDYSNNATSWSSDLTNTSGDIITSPMQINGLSQANTHPAVYDKFSNLQVCRLVDLFDGTVRFSIDDVFANTIVSSEFDLNNITQGYFLYYGGNYNFIVTEASTTQVYVDANGYLNSTVAKTYQTTAISIGGVTNTKLDRRLYPYTDRIYGARGEYTLPNSMVLSTNDIYDTNNQLVFEANATLQEFKNAFNLS